MQVFRSKFSRVLASATVLVLALAWALVLASQGPAAALATLPTAALLGYLALISFWLPKVSANEELVIIENILRSHRIAVNAIKRIDTKWSLTLVTEKRSYSAWGAPAPGRHTSIFASRDQGSHLPESTYLGGTVRPGDLVNTDSGAPAAYIRRIWESRTDGPADESTTWHYSRIVILLALLAANLLF